MNLLTDRKKLYEFAQKLEFIEEILSNHLDILIF